MDGESLGDVEVDGTFDVGINGDMCMVEDWGLGAGISGESAVLSDVTFPKPCPSGKLSEKNEGGFVSVSTGCIVGVAGTWRRAYKHDRDSRSRCIPS